MTTSTDRRYEPVTQADLELLRRQLESEIKMASTRQEMWLMLACMWTGLITAGLTLLIVAAAHSR